MPEIENPGMDPAERAIHQCQREIHAIAAKYKAAGVFVVSVAGHESGLVLPASNLAKRETAIQVLAVAIQQIATTEKSEESRIVVPRLGGH